MPRTEEQNREIREKSRKLIIETALRLFSANGFHSTSINKIAKEAGIVVGLIYNYFKSKEDLLDQIFKDSLADFNRLLEVNSKEAIEKNDLISLIDTIFDIIKLKIDTWRLIISVTLQPEVANIGLRNIQSFTNNTFEFSEIYFRRKGDSDPEKKPEYWRNYFMRRHYVLF